MSEFSNLIGSASFNDGRDPRDSAECADMTIKHGYRRRSKNRTAHSDSCLDRCLHCLSHVPCASLVAWIAMLIGLGGVTGSLMIGADRTRELLLDDLMLWFMEYTLIGVISGMFVIGTGLLCLGHLSSEPNCRHAFNTSRKNACARGFNIFMLVLSYILGLAWIFTSAILAIPAALLVLLVYLSDYREVRCIDLVHYGFSRREICGEALERFTNDGKDLLECYVAAFFSAVLVIVSLVHFLMCISANVTHLREARFATLNAYEETEEAQNSKHSIVDTTM